MYFKSQKELNYDRFVDLNILGAARLVHSDLRIYRISVFLLDWNTTIGVKQSVSNIIQVWDAMNPMLKLAPVSLLACYFSISQTINFNMYIIFLKAL